MGIFSRYKRQKLELELLKAQAKDMDITARAEQADTRRRRKEALDLKKEIELLELLKEKTIRQAELDDLINDISGGDEESGLFGAEELMLAKIMGIDLNNFSPQSLATADNTPHDTPISQEKAGFSRVDGLLSAVPKDLLIKLSKLTWTDQVDLIKSKVPDITEAEILEATEKIAKLK